MNIEEYKLAIMKQLREPHSAMRCLMSQWKMRERKTKPIYHMCCKTPCFSYGDIKHPIG